MTLTMYYPEQNEESHDNSVQIGSIMTKWKGARWTECSEQVSWKLKFITQFESPVGGIKCATTIYLQKKMEANKHISVLKA